MSPYVSLSETQWPHELPKEIVAAPVEGWRIWRVYPAYARLGAVGIGPVRWDRVERAQCWERRTLAPPHPSPDALCGCGLWAFKDDSRVMETLRQYAGHNLDLFGYGRVQLWGRIIECEHGWRGEYARPLQVTLLGSGLPATAQAIREFYGCEVTVEDVPEEVSTERAGFAAMSRQASLANTAMRWNQSLGTWTVALPDKRRRPNPGALMCLGIAIFNVVFACFEAFVIHTSWAPNAAAAAATFVLSCLCWRMP